MTKKVGFYPGCSLEGTAKDFKHSVIDCAKRLDIELAEIQDWNCCGASSAHSLNHDLSVALPARVLAQAKEQGVTEVLAPCAMCYANLKRVNHECKDELKLKKINKIIEQNYNLEVQTLNLFEFISKYGKEKLEEAEKKLKGMKVACYYGCLLVRPPEVTEYERYEDPLIMEEIVKSAGAEPVSWNFKTECCGGGLVMSQREAIEELVARICENAKLHEADIILAACPMCHANLDMRQQAASKLRGKNIGMPILYLSEFVALALGAGLKDLKINTHITESEGFLKKYVA